MFGAYIFTFANCFSSVHYFFSETGLEHDEKYVGQRSKNEGCLIIRKLCFENISINFLKHTTQKRIKF